MKANTTATLLGIGMVAALVALPAASADPTTGCALDPFPPCAQVDVGSTYDDRDCDDSNGSGGVSHSVRAWTGNYPLGNSSVWVDDECNRPYGTTTYDQVLVWVEIYTPLNTYRTKLAQVYWQEIGGNCYAGVSTSGTGANVRQDLGPVLCPVGGPPTVPALP